MESVSERTGRRSSRLMDVDLGEHAEGLEVGHSVAVNGVCLTATALRGTTCTFEMIEETVSTTSLGDLAPDDVVNIERSLRVGTAWRGTTCWATWTAPAPYLTWSRPPGEVRVRVGLPPALASHTVRKGSIAVDGISLTVTESYPDGVSFSLIPHTVRTTNFSGRKPGDRVNIETDILAKYALKEDLPN